MKGITEAAKEANGRSQTCAICPVLDNHKICPPEFQRVCSDAFIEGFKKGVKWLQKQHKNESSCFQQ